MLVPGTIVFVFQNNTILAQQFPLLEKRLSYLGAYIIPQYRNFYRKVASVGGVFNSADHCMKNSVSRSSSAECVLITRERRISKIEYQHLENLKIWHV